MGVYKRGGFRNFRNKVARIAKKGMRKAGQAIKSRYYGGNKLNVAQIASDVAMLQRMVNVEKKRISVPQTTGVHVGQVNGNASTAVCLDITPTPVEGAGYSNRNGASVKLTSWHLQIQLTQQSASQHPMKVKFMVFHVKGAPITASTFPSLYYNANPFIGGAQVVDLNSSTNSDNYSKFSLVRSKTVTLAPDPLSGTTMIKTFSLGMKYGKNGRHLRFDGDNNTITSGQLLLVALADSGNRSTTTASTLTGIPVSAINTGAFFYHELKAYYVDN